MARCLVCGRIILPWHKSVKSRDGIQQAHEKCKPEGFHAAASIAITLLYSPELNRLFSIGVQEKTLETLLVYVPKMEITNAQFPSPLLLSHRKR
jgi:hypothetical protein